VNKVVLKGVKNIRVSLGEHDEVISGRVVVGEGLGEGMGEVNIPPPPYVEGNNEAKPEDKFGVQPRNIKLNRKRLRGRSDSLAPSLALNSHSCSPSDPYLSANQLPQPQNLSRNLPTSVSTSKPTSTSHFPPPKRRRLRTGPTATTTATTTPETIPTIPSRDHPSYPSLSPPHLTPSEPITPLEAPLPCNPLNPFPRLPPTRHFPNQNQIQNLNQNHNTGKSSPLPPKRRARAKGLQT